MKIVKEEIFGPVVAISKFSTEAEAIAKANDTSYGLAAAVFTQKVARAFRLEGISRPVSEESLVSMPWMLTRNLKQSM
jgi:acyl-CoA reductase-like NAD-dependent aldehyde dehydrogenase